jgi:hypothetical protein
MDSRILDAAQDVIGNDISRYANNKKMKGPL